MSLFFVGNKLCQKRRETKSRQNSLNCHIGEANFKKPLILYETTGRKAQAWQKGLLKHIMAYNSGSLWVHTKFGYSVSRRNGKNEVIAIREMWGIVSGEQILHTAHRTTTSHTAWERLCMLLDNAGIQYDSLKASGRENTTLPDTGGRT